MELLLRRPDGSLMAAAQGVEPGEAAKDIAVWTFDAWGYGSCKASGGCAAQPASACDDDDACTADSCLPAGCSHAPLSDGAMCAVGKTCKKGSCAN